MLCDDFIFTRNFSYTSGMPSNKVVKKVTSPWTEDDMREAIHLCLSTTDSKRSIAKRCGVDEATLRRRLKQRDAGKSVLEKPGRKTVFAADVESLLADCISTLCRNGFSPTLEDIKVSKTVF